jgi:hypothetical protein
MGLFDFFGSSKNQPKQSNGLNEFKPFTFVSNQHQRYENGTPVMGVQNCIRTLTVEKNVNGCDGYIITPGDGYILKAMNMDVNPPKPQFAAKPMRIVGQDANKVELRGYMLKARSPFGYIDFDLSDYSFTVYYNNGEVSKCVLHMLDRGVDLEYRKV